MSDDHPQDAAENPTAKRAIDRVEGDPPVGNVAKDEPVDVPGEQAPDGLKDEIGAEGGSKSPSNHTPTPFHPADDESAWGDTDQHSKA